MERIRTRWRSACVVASAAVAAVLAGCGDPPQPPPEEIRGVWRSDAPRYRDRYFEVRADAVLFGKGAYMPANHFFLVTTEAIDSPDANGKRWRLHYREDDGEVADLEILYEARPRERLRFANQSEWWMRGTRDVVGDGDA